MTAVSRWMRGLSPATLAAWGLVGCVVLGASRAEALSCAEPGLQVPGSRTDVPTNTLVWCSVGWNAPAEIVLKDAAGGVVSGTQTRLSTHRGDVLVFRPGAALEPNQSYSADCPVKAFTFSTAAGPRTTPPAVPVVPAPEIRSATGGWGDWFSAIFPQVAPSFTIVVFDVDGSATLTPAGPAGFVSDVQISGGLDPLWLLKNICDATWPEAALGVSSTVSMGVFDETGAFSGWSEPRVISLPSAFDGAPDAGGSPDDSSADAGAREPSGGVWGTDAGANLVVADAVLTDGESETSSSVPPGAAPAAASAGKGCGLATRGGATSGGAAASGGAVALAALALASYRRRARALPRS